MSDPSPRRTRRSELLHLWLAAVMALLAATAVILFFVAEANACSIDFPSPECEFQQADLQAMPDCVDAEHHVHPDMDGGCNFMLDVENNCNKSLELAFFCDFESEWKCSDDRVIESGQHKEIGILRLSNSTVGDSEDDRWEESVGMQLQGLEESNDDNNGESSDNETEDPGDGEDNQNSGSEGEAEEYESAATFDLSAEYNDDPEPPDCSMMGPFGFCGSSSSTAPVSIALVVIALLALTRLRRPDDEPLTTNQ